MEPVGVEYRVLGPLEVVSGGVVRAPALRLRTLLAALLVDHRAPLRPDALIEAMWAGRRSQDATATLRRHIARARADLGVEIETAQTGYRLVVEDDSIDAVRLVSSVRTARHGTSGEDLRASLGLWRSSPFPELADWGPGRLAAAALEEVHIEGLELAVRADVDRGPPSAELFGELERIVEEHPYRETFWVLLVLALYRAGRQHDALNTVQRARRQLADDLGVLPGPELVAVERAVLDHTPDIRLPPGNSPMLPPRLRPPRRPTAPLIGRADALQMLTDAWERVNAQGVGEVVLIRGESGIGKTRLARDFALLVTDRGGRVTYGQCDDELGAPFEPLASVLRDVLRTGGAPPPHLRSTLGVVLPELAGAPAGPGQPVAVAALADAAVAWLEQLAAESPLVVVVDDLHWITVSGAGLLHALASRVAAGLPILVVALARSETDDRLDRLAAMSVTRVELRPLAGTELATLSALLGVRPEMSDAEVLHATGGVPLLVELLAEAGPEPVETVTRRVRQLGSDAADLLRLAALEPGEFRLDVTAAAVDLPGGTALHVLDRATVARVVDEIGIGRFRFRHALVQDALANSLSATRRADLHHRLADATRLTTPTAVDRVAHHLDLAGPSVSMEAIEALVRAGYATVDRSAAPEALAFVDRASEKIASLEPGQRAKSVTWQLDCAIVRARALALLGDPGWSDAALDAAERADRIGDVDRLVDAVLVTQRYLTAVGFKHTDPRRVALLQRALDRLDAGGDPRRALVLAALADALRHSGDRLRMDDLRRQVASIGDEATLPARERAQLLMRLGGLFEGDGAIPARLAAAAALVELHARNPDDVPIRQMTAFTNVLAAATSGDGPGLRRWLDVMALGIGSPEAPLAPWSVPLCQSWWALANGDLAAAEACAAAARDAGQRIGVPDAEAVFSIQSASVHIERSAGPGTWATPEGARAAAFLRGTNNAFELAFLAGEDPPAARLLLARSVADGFADADHASERLTALYACVASAVALDDAPAAEVLYELLEPSCGSMISTGISLNPSVDYACAQCALTMGSWQRAATHLAAADALHERLGASRLIAVARLLRGELELRRPGGDAGRAAALANEVARYATPRRLGRLLAHAGPLAARAVTSRP